MFNFSCQKVEFHWSGLKFESSSAVNCMYTMAHCLKLCVLLCIVPVALCGLHHKEREKVCSRAKHCELLCREHACYNRV